jgi:hypothetical protein
VCSIGRNDLRNGISCLCTTTARAIGAVHRLVGGVGGAGGSVIGVVATTEPKGGQIGSVIGVVGGVVGA